MLEHVEPLSECAGAPIAKASALVYLVFERRALTAQRAFMEEFGLQTLALEGTTLHMRCKDDPFYCVRYELGQRDRLLGLGLEVATRAELLRLATACSVQPEAYLSPVPHERVLLRDPHGLRVEVLWRSEHRSPACATELTPERAVGVEVRLALKPASVSRLGHVVLDVFDFRASVTWYREHLGFLPTDVLCLDSGEPVVAFLRLDRGVQPTEHHSLVISSNIQVGCSHSAYEVAGYDDMAMGQQILQRSKRKHVWGIGRHLLGSQLFDYWRDPAGDVVEHYADSDRYDESRPVEYHRLTSSGLYQWGPNVPSSFGLPALDRHKVKTLLHALWTRKLKLRRVLNMKAQLSQPARGCL